MNQNTVLSERVLCSRLLLSSLEMSAAASSSTEVQPLEDNPPHDDQKEIMSDNNHAHASPHMATSSMGLPHDHLDELMGSDGVPVWDAVINDGVVLDYALFEVHILVDPFQPQLWSHVAQALPSPARFMTTLRRYAKYQWILSNNRTCKRGKIMPAAEVVPFESWHTHRIVGSTTTITNDLSDRRRNFQVLMATCSPNLNFKSTEAAFCKIGPQTRIDVKYFLVNDNTRIEVFAQDEETAIAAALSATWPADVYVDLRALWLHPDEYNLETVVKTNPSVGSIPLLNRHSIETMWYEMKAQSVHVGDMEMLQHDGLLPYALPIGPYSKPQGLCFFGSPGTNKSNVARTLMYGLRDQNGDQAQLPWRPIWSGSSGELHRGIVGETEALIMRMANRSRVTPHVLSVIFFDEIDTLGQKRSHHQSTEHSRAWLSLVLRILGAPEYRHLFVIGTTNRWNDLDEAFTRPGRLDVLCYFPRLQSNERVVLLQSLLNEHPAIQFDSALFDATLDIIKRRTLNWSGAMLRKCVSHVRRQLLVRGTSPATINHPSIILDAIREITTHSMEHDIIAYEPTEELPPSCVTAFLPLRELVLDAEGVNTNPFTGTILLDRKQLQVEVSRTVGFQITQVPGNRNHAPALIQYLACDVLDATVYFHIDTKRLGASNTSSSEFGAGSVAAKMDQMLQDAAAAGSIKNGRAVVVFDLDNLVSPGDQVQHQSGNSVHTITGGTPQTTAQNSSSSSFVIYRRNIFNDIVNILQTYPKWNASRRMCFVVMVQHPTLMKEFKAALNWTLPFHPLSLTTLHPLSTLLLNGTELYSDTVPATGGSAIFDQPLAPGVHYMELIPGASLASLNVGVAQIDPNQYVMFNLDSNATFWAFGSNASIRFWNKESSKFFLPNPLTATSRIGVMMDLLPGGLQTLSLYVDGKFCGILFTGLPRDNLHFVVSIRAPNLVVKLCPDAPIPTFLPPALMSPSPLRFGSHQSGCITWSQDGRSLTASNSNEWQSVLSTGLPRSGKLYNEIRLDAGVPNGVLLGFTVNLQQTRYSGSDANSGGFHLVAFGPNQGVDVYHNAQSTNLRPPQNSGFETHMISLGDKFGLLIDLDTAPWRGLVAMFHLPINGTPKMIGIIATGLLETFPSASHFYMRLSICGSTRATINDKADINTPYHIEPMLRNPGAHVPYISRTSGYHKLLANMISPTQLSFKASVDIIYNQRKYNWMNVLATTPFKRAECHYVEFEIVQHHVYTMFGVAPISFPYNDYLGSVANSIGVRIYPTATTVDVHESGKITKTTIAEPLVLCDGARIGMLLDFTDITSDRDVSLSFYALIPVPNEALVIRHICTTWTQANTALPMDLKLVPAFALHTGGAVRFASDHWIADPKAQLLRLSV